MRTPAGWIERHAASSPERIALRFGEDSWSYAAFAARIARLTRWLETEAGVQRGDRVAWLGHNHPDLLALLFACAEAGAALVPLNWRLSAAEINRILEDAAPAVLVVEEGAAELATDLSRGPDFAVGSVWPGVPPLPPEAAGDTLVARDADADEIMLLVYTSGTTGRPKGTALSQRALLFNALNAQHMHDLAATDRVLTVLPLFHVGGLNIQTTPAFYCGAEVVLEPRFDPATVIRRIERTRPTLTTLVPAMMSALFALPAWEGVDLRSLRAIATGSTDVPRPLIDALHARQVPVIQIYGATETGPVAIYQRIDEAFATAGAIGRPGLHTDVRLVDARGNDVADGEPGEVLVRGPHVASGYWNPDYGSVDPFPGGWFASGDVAARDSTGVYWFRDRIKHVIISGGENIYPAELERILHASGLLREAAVAGRPDQRWGEVPVVVAVRADEAVDAGAVLALFESGIARYKRPRDVLFVDALPRNAMGKVEVTCLRELVRAH